MERKEIYHLYSDGFRTECLFQDIKAFVAGMNIAALCFLKSHVMILAFCLMDNHVHFVLSGTYDECVAFRNRFMHRYSIWFSNRYASERLSAVDFDIKPITDERYLLTSIAYVLRNSISSGYRFCVEDYLWSSGGLYFRMPEKLQSIVSGWKRVADLSSREKRRCLQTMDELPSEWLITPEGFIWPGNYVDYRYVEHVYRTPKSFAFFMGQTKEDEVNRSLGIYSSVFLPDLELREKAVARSLELFGLSNLRNLDVQKRILLGKDLRKEFKCSSKQIARIIHLDPVYIKELV